ncbi:MAG: hypothetical protein H6823_09570 [Planctomycetaceae bacterium]|nr:hypothetical protein [Planctomycetaceae bacterium]
MSHQPPSQTRVLLLLAASMVAGLTVATIISDREVTRRDNPSTLKAESLVAESP